MAREMDFVDECYAGKDLSLLKKLTLVIPTYNRNYYLSRCLWYHAHFPFGQIIVADSSPEEMKVVNRETVAKVREMFGADILYLEYEPETEKYGGDVYRKWWDAVMHVETEYSQICTDKEFMIPTTLVNDIDFLDVHSDYVISHGCEYGVCIQNTSDSNNMILFKRHPSRTAEFSPDARNRLIHSIKSCPPFANTTLLSLTRTVVLQNIYEEYYNNSRPHDLRYGEIYLAYGGYIVGKVNYNIELVSRIRDEIGKFNDAMSSNRIDSTYSNESSSLRYPKYFDYLKSRLVNIYYSSINSAFSDLFEKNTVFSSKEIQDCLRVIGPYLKRTLRHRNVDVVAERIWERYKQKWYDIPIGVRRKLKQVFKNVVNIDLPLSEKEIKLNIINNDDWRTSERIICDIIHYRTE